MSFLVPRGANLGSARLALGPLGLHVCRLVIGFVSLVSLSLSLSLSAVNLCVRPRLSCSLCLVAVHLNVRPRLSFFVSWPLICGFDFISSCLCFVVSFLNVAACGLFALVVVAFLGLTCALLLFLLLSFLVSRVLSVLVSVSSGLLASSSCDVLAG